MPEALPVALIVRCDTRDDELAKALTSAGYVVVTTDTFSAARRRLMTDVELLITDLRLGEYNGLHLVLLAKHQRPDLEAVVIADAADDVLRREAESLDATFMVRHGREQDLVRSVLELVRTARALRAPIGMRTYLTTATEPAARLRLDCRRAIHQLLSPLIPGIARERRVALPIIADPGGRRFGYFVKTVVGAIALLAVWWAFDRPSLLQSTTARANK